NVIRISIVTCFFYFFFFSSRRRHTRSYGDWSSDVCSSDLRPDRRVGFHYGFRRDDLAGARPVLDDYLLPHRLRKPVRQHSCRDRSEERRVGKECRSRWAREHEKEKERVCECGSGLLACAST